MLGEDGVVAVGGDGLEAEVVEVGLERPEAVAGDVGVGGEGVEDVFEVGEVFQSVWSQPNSFTMNALPWLVTVAASWVKVAAVVGGWLGPRRMSQCG